MAERYVISPPNEKGRDFVVGDIHGCFDLVLRAMDAVSFDSSVDRLFAVGDYIDRGPDSHRVVRFLRHDWVLGVLGNHEDMLLELYAGEPLPEEVLALMCRQNGLNWWLSTPESLRQEVLEAIRPLPVVRELQTPRGSVGFVHAEVPRGLDWRTFVANIQAGDSHTIKSALWGRTRVNRGLADGVPGIGRVFVGHTPVGSPTRLGNVYAVDTGAVFGLLNSAEDGQLSMLNILCKTATVTEAPGTPRTLVRTYLEEPAPALPFGNYLGR